MIALQFEQKHCVAKAISVWTSLACTNWLAPNLGARNDLVSVFHQILTLCEGRAAPDYDMGWLITGMGVTNNLYGMTNNWYEVANNWYGMTNNWYGVTSNWLLITGSSQQVVTGTHRHHIITSSVDSGQWVTTGTSHWITINTNTVIQWGESIW